MPTINFSLKDLQHILGKNITIKELEELLVYCKGSVENYDNENDDVTAELADTNLPYLWSTEGIARLLKGALGIETGLAKIKVNNSKYQIVVDSSVEGVRPYIVAFAARGKKVDGYLIKQIIQLQEKLCENFGRRRQKVAIGVYRLSKIKFPVHYKATDPESIKFIPLDFRVQMTQQEIIENHPKGKEYAWILEGAKKYPILMDSNENVLSFPPIINSAETGKIEEGDSELFFEATGTDLKLLNIAANIFAHAFHERGFEIYSTEIKYKNNTVKTPELGIEKIKLDKKDVEKMIGIKFTDGEIKKFLEKTRYGVKGNMVNVPCYRSDILHPVDLIEDIAIMHGYNKIKGLPLSEYTIGRTFDIIKFIDNIRDLMAGQGYNEVLSPILSNKELLCDKMRANDASVIEISNKMSETFSCLRSWLIPIMLDVLSKNKHVDYPQRIFEEGLVTLKEGNEANDYEKIVVVTANKTADFTEAKQVLSYVMDLIGIEYRIEEIKHESFIPGRVGKILVQNKEVGLIGEVHPETLKNFNLEMPVAALELNITKLFEMVGK